MQKLAVESGYSEEGTEGAGKSLWLFQKIKNGYAILDHTAEIVGHLMSGAKATK